MDISRGAQAPGNACISMRPGGTVDSLDVIHPPEPHHTQRSRFCRGTVSGILLDLAAHLTGVPEGLRILAGAGRSPENPASE